MLEQLRTLDKARLREYMGSVSQYKMREIDDALSTSIGLAHMPMERAEEQQEKIPPQVGFCMAT